MFPLELLTSKKSKKGVYYYIYFAINNPGTVNGIFCFNKFIALFKIT